MEILSQRGRARLCPSRKENENHEDTKNTKGKKAPFYTTAIRYNADVVAYVAEAIVTGARRYGEADRLLTLFTRDRGRIGAIAKSARKPKSSIRGATEPFIRAKFELAEGRSLSIVRSAEILNPNLELREHWTRLQLAGHVAEIANKMSVEGVPDPGLYDLLAKAIEQIGEGRIDAVAKFKVGLLDHLGVFPDLTGCSECNAARVKGNVHLDHSRHGFLCSECAELLHVHYPVPMKVLHCFHSLRAGKDFDLEDDLLDTADEVLNNLLQGFLQAAFKTVSAAKKARTAEREKENSNRKAMEDNNVEP